MFSYQAFSSRNHSIYFQELYLDPASYDMNCRKPSCQGGSQQVLFRKEIKSQEDHVRLFCLILATTENFTCEAGKRDRSVVSKSLPLWVRQSTTRFALGLLETSKWCLLS
jgi:hypothetical protein